MPDKASTTPDATPAEPDETLPETPISQGNRRFRQNWPQWAKQLPRFRNFPPMDESFQLIDRQKLDELFKRKGINQQSARRVHEDIEFMDYELLRLFRQRDHDASYHQNRYRLFQFWYIILATIATFIGGLLALALNANPNLVPWLAFAETVIALATTFIAAVSGREPPLPLWMENRRKAEFLRREYFRYLANLEPYSDRTGYERQQLLSRRAARINRGDFPEMTEV